ncbi:MAG: ABC transporter permease [Elusimicrobia bacterium]|nr:ABC transporter permease [Elusimicrobiota bacterium]
MIRARTSSACRATLLRNISYRLLRVWQRNFDVSRVTWKTNVLPPLLEPMLYIFAFGFGLGAYVERISFQGRTYDYVAFLAPGMVAVGVMFHSVFECMYGAFVRMRYQKTFEAILHTPLLIEDILAGEVLWGATKGLFAGTAILAVITAFGLASYPASLLILPASFAAGIMFAGFGLLFAAVSPYIDNLNLPTFLFITPMFLFSGTFFPLDGMPTWLKAVAAALPLTHLVEVTRAAAFGRLSWGLAVNFAFLAVVGLAVSYQAIKLMKGRLIK